MNIFALDNDPLLAAKWQHDRHVVKMTLETCQLLSTAVWHNPLIRGYWTEVHGEFRPGIDNIDSGSARLYKSISNPNHPVAVWSRESLPNFVWTWAHGFGLISEYHRRFQKRHGCWAVIASFMDVIQAITEVDSLWYKERTEPAPGKHHKVTSLNPAVLDYASSHSPFAVCMPDEFKWDSVADDNVAAIESYRILYLESKIFQDHVKWTRCDLLSPFIMNEYEFPAGNPKVHRRVTELVRAHREQVSLQRAPNPLTTHPDLLKPVNPKAVTRFGTKPTL